MGVVLRRCPFCGGKAVLMWNYSGGFYYTRVKCTVCDTQCKSYRSEVSPSDKGWDTPSCRKAVAIWNTRVCDRIDPKDIDDASYVEEFAGEEK